MSMREHYYGPLHATVFLDILDTQLGDFHDTAIFVRYHYYTFFQHWY